MSAALPMSLNFELRVFDDWQPQLQVRVRTVSVQRQTRQTASASAGGNALQSAEDDDPACANHTRRAPRAVAASCPSKQTMNDSGLQLVVPAVTTLGCQLPVASTVIVPAAAAAAAAVMLLQRPEAQPEGSMSRA